jgi:hypothetical protein
MHTIHDSYTVYLFPKGIKRLSRNLSGYELNKLTLEYGTPIKTICSYEDVVKEDIK